MLPDPEPVGQIRAGLTPALRPWTHDLPPVSTSGPRNGQRMHLPGVLSALTPLHTHRLASAVQNHSQVAMVMPIIPAYQEMNQEPKIEPRDG